MRKPINAISIYLTRFRRKRHSRYIGLRELVTNAVGFKKNSERHIFEVYDLPFPIANSKLLQDIINYEKMLFKQKKKHDFSALFFLKTEFSRAFLSAINLEPFQSVE